MATPARSLLHTGVLALCAILAAACDADGDGRGAGFAAYGDTAPDYSSAAAAGTATVRVLYVPAEGFAWQEDGSLTGVTVEIMHAFRRWVRDNRGVDLRLDFVAEEDWRTFYDRVQHASGGVFGIGNVTITDERRAELAFSPPYMNNVAVLITDESVPVLGSLEDVPDAFDGLSGLAFAGTLHEARVRALQQQYLPDAPVQPAASNDEIVERVGAGGYFAFIDAYNYWRASERGSSLRRHPVADDAAETFGVIMPHDSDWAPIITAFFEDDGGYLGTAEYRGILLRHLGEPLTALLTQPDGTD
jgi:ABC-type amino acid transport substrate-binding protein